MSRSTIKSAIGELVRTVAPNYWAQRGWKRHFSDLKRLFHEQELYVAPLLCEKRKTSIVNKHTKGLEFLMKKNKVTVISGCGKLTGAAKDGIHTVALSQVASIATAVFATLPCATVLLLIATLRALPT